MNRIPKAFGSGKAFIGFITAGDPSLKKTADFVRVMAESGCDLVELGIPFSDPIAEGETIQRANLRALQNDVSLERIFETVADIRTDCDVPLVFLTYANPVFRYGYERFFSDCETFGVDGVILPDVPYEERGELAGFAAAHGVEVITLIAPTSSQRVARLAEEASGFVYLVSSMGVTGVRRDIVTDLAPLIAGIRAANPRIPVAIGFGIATEEQSAGMAALADGVIVGSAVVRIVEQYGEAADAPLSKYVSRMKAAAQGKKQPV